VSDGDDFYRSVRRRLRFLPGDVVTGTHPKKGEIIGRVGLVNSLGGVLVNLDNGRLAGFGPDDLHMLRVIECVVGTPWESNEAGDTWLKEPS
jgi:hypothetical protein